MRKLLFIFLLLPVFANATTYYVASALHGGNDTNPGTITLPWLTKAKVSASSFVGGDNILFYGGDTFPTTTLTFSNSNISSTSSSSKVTIDSYNGGNAILTSTATDGVDLTNISGIVIQNITLTGDGTNGAGIYASAQGTSNTKYTAGLTFTNLVITGFDTGISLGGDAPDGSASGFTNGTITNNTIHDCINHGIITYGAAYGVAPSHTNLLVQGNTVYNVVGVSGTGSASGNGIVLGEASTSTVQNNLVHDCGINNTSSSGPVGNWCYDSTAITIQFNEVYNQKTNSGTDGGGFDIDGGSTDCILQYNYSHDNYGPGFMFYAYSDGYVGTWNNNICRYNISVNDATQNTGNYSALLVSANSTMTNSYMYNNTAYNNNSGSTLLGLIGSSVASATGIVSNNILYAETGVRLISADANTTLTLTGNDYYNTGSFLIHWNGTDYTTFSSWYSATGQEVIMTGVVGKTLNPLLVSPGSSGANNYKLQSGSPVSANGLNLSSIYTITVGARDYFGDGIPNSAGNYSIGAHQPLRFTGRIFLN